MTNRIPHLSVVVSVSAFVLAGFAAVSGWVLIYSNDDVTKGNVIGTWINFAMLAVGFWLGSSSGGKTTTETDVPDTAKGAANQVAEAAQSEADNITKLEGN